MRNFIHVTLIHPDLISFTLQNTSIYRQLSVYIHYLLYRNFWTSYCLCAGLVQIELIPQVYCINKVTSHNKNYMTDIQKLIYIEHSCKWKEISDRQLTRKHMYNGITLITLHIVNTLLAQRLPPMLSDRSVYTEMEFC